MSSAPLPLAPRVALVHDWLTGMRGGELVLEAIAELFVAPELFTLVCAESELSASLRALPRRVSWLQRIPGVVKRYRSFLPLMPSAIESFDLSGYDLVISSSHCVAKGVRKSEGAVHVSYVHAPMRYMWERFDDYFGPGKASLAVRAAAHAFRPRLQAWDRRVSSEARIDRLIANSRFIAGQIERAYGRQADVIYPFADLSRFSRIASRTGSHYLMVGAFAPNKRVDLAIEAFNRLRLPLFIVGAGQEEARLRKLAGPTIKMLGKLSNPEIADLYSSCRAFIFPGIEDFGITPLEAMASGAPVIAYGEGGAAETVTDQTGVLFRPQTVEALMDAVTAFARGDYKFQESDCRARAAQFTRARFQRELLGVIRETWRKKGKDSVQLESRIRPSFR
ncbi:MAG: glycosyltransferase [Oligoflexia bacterium]|nr:glycosyltransferase [Oligoflexia bacterium]